jgi:microcystin-dependent protein
MLSLPNDLANHTPADAAPVQANYEWIEQYINAEVITRDGRVGMQAQLSLVGDPVAPLDAAPKQYVESILPVGVVFPYCGIAAPAGGKWALANGAQLQESSYQKLFDMIGYRYGGASGLFNLPNLTGRVIIGLDQRLAPDFDERFNLAGETGGTFTVPVPAHTHPNNHDHAQFNTAVENTGHHHSNAHDHPSVNTSPAGGHTPVAKTARRASGPGSTQSLMPAGTTGAADTSEDSVKIDAVPTHQHAVDLPSYVGNTGDRSASHNHPVNIPAYVGTTGQTGTAAAQMVPPYIVMAYIVRIA